MDTQERRWNFVERYDWVVWVLLGLLGVLVGATDMLTGGSTYGSGEAVLFGGITGTTWDELQAAAPGPARFIDYQARLAGAQILWGGLLTFAISLFGLRRGQRWAWLTMWVLGPLNIGLGVVMLLLPERTPGAGVPGPLVAQPILLIITAGLLLLTYRKYNRSRVKSSRSITSG